VTHVETLSIYPSSFARNRTSPSFLFVTPRFPLERDKHVTWAGNTHKEHAKHLTCKLYHFFVAYK